MEWRTASINSECCLYDRQERDAGFKDDGGGSLLGIEFWEQNGVGERTGNALTQEDGR